MVEVGQRVERYDVTAKLGQGGMARVFKAIHEDGTVVALKVFAADDLSHPEFLKRCRREVAALKQCSHPNIVKVHGYAIDEKSGFVGMEFIDGVNLDQLVRTSGRQGKSLIFRVARDIASALTYCHARGLYHRDLKPANIMIEKGSGRAVLLDFGLVKATQMTEISIANQVMGTLCYMSPEQFIGQTVDGRTDVYQLGLVLYKLITSRDPSPISEVIEGGKIPDRSPLMFEGADPSLPAGLFIIIENCTALRREERYPAAQKILEDLERAEQGKPITRRRTIPPTKKVPLRETGPVDATLRSAVSTVQVKPPRRWILHLIGLSPIIALLILLGVAVLVRSR